MTYALFDALPKLESLPRMTLASLPTAVEKLNLKNSAGEQLSNVWAKRDDLSNPRYGGNKVRKLELILAAARAARKKQVVTMGAIGSNHAVATAINAKECGFACKVFLFDQPANKKVLTNLKAMASLDAELDFRGSMGATAWAYTKSSVLNRNAYHLPAGGSNALGCIAFVNAAFELKQQIEAGELPMPDKIVCALGSNGSVAGLTLGCALSGLPIEVIGVRVTPSHLGPIPVATQGAVSALMKKALAELSRYDSSIKLDDLPKVMMTEDYYAGGYGQSNQKIETSKQLMTKAGLTVDLTYSAKAASALIDIASAHPEQTVLYWSTLNSAPLEPQVSEAQLSRLQPQLRELIEMGDRL